MGRLPDSSATYNICLVSIDKQEVAAGIVHLGQGKFQIVKHDGGEQHVGKIIDASNIIHCRICSVCKDEWLPKEAFKTLRCTNCKSLIMG